MVDPAGIRRFGPPHNPSPKPRMFNVYVESGKKKKTLNWFDLVRTPLYFHFPARGNSGSDPAVCSRKIKTKSVCNIW